MHYPQQYYPQHQYKQDPRLQKLKQDNLQLQKSLHQLNQCYQQKISLLQQQLTKSKQRQQTLLQWKSSYIDKQLFNNVKYEQELQKMVTMMQEMARNYQKQNVEMKKLLQDKDEAITHLKDQNVYLRQERDQRDQKIQGIAQKYIGEIQRLNNQLKELKEEINYDQSQCVGENDFSVQNEMSSAELREEGNANDNIEETEQYAQLIGEKQDILKDISNHSSVKNIIVNLAANQKTSLTQSITQLKGQLIC